MKLPRDVSGEELVRGLRRLGYEVDRQVGSHMILRCEAPRSHSITVPNHKPIKIGTLSSILHELALQRSTSVERILEALKL